MMRAAVSASLLVMLSAFQVGAMEIVKYGRSDYKIVIPDVKSPSVGYASKELQHYLKQITGVQIPIVSESAAEGGPAFYLGRSKRNLDAGLVKEAGKLREDGVLIKSSGNDIALLGQNERGNLYSVYVLLEKYMGIRFLAWDCTVVPKRRDLLLPDINYSYSPPFMYRETLYYNSFPKEIAAQQRLNGPYTRCDESVGGKIDFYPYVHSFNVLFPPDEYFKEHPEYYGLQGGKRVSGDVHAQLCLSNPNVLRLAKAKVLKWIDEHPNVPIIDVSQNDGNGPCECEKCMAIVAEEGSQHGPILRFVNAIADEVAKKYPRIWVETLAYAYSTKPPAITKPRRNVIIRLCHAGCYFHGFDQCGLGANLTSYIDQWSKLTKRIFIWHYATNFAHYIAPNQNLAGLATDIKSYSAQGVNGLMIQCDYQSPGGELAELRQYIAAQLLWDPSRDPTEIRTEFCNGYYGRASEIVMEFLLLMDKVSQVTDVHAFGAWDPQTTVTPEFVENALKILNKARDAAENTTIRRRVEKLMLPYWYMKLTYPAKYALSEKDAPSLWKQAKKVLLRNKMTHIREGGENAQPWATEMDALFAPQPKDMVFDLMQINQAKTRNCADWRISSITRDGRLLRTIFQHPDGKGNADAAYLVTLPSLPAGRKLTMKFGTVISNKTSDGVRFSVLVNGDELWSETKTSFISSSPPASRSSRDSILPSERPFSDVALDLTTYAGSTITLTLRVNALAGNDYDWANWVDPKVVIVK